MLNQSHCFHRRVTLVSSHPTADQFTFGGVSVNIHQTKQTVLIIDVSVVGQLCMQNQP